MIQELKGVIHNVHIQNPLLYDYDDIIFQLEVQELDEMGWNAQLMFKSNQIIDIMRQFDVRFAYELSGQECYLLDESTNTKVPMGIKHQQNDEYIEVFNEYFATLWK